MVETKDPSLAAKRWADSISFVPTRYAEGVNSAKPWQSAALAAEGRYQAALQESFSRNARSAGISRTNDSEWKQRAINKGSRNIQTGMNEGKAKQASAIAKVISVIRGVSLPERTLDPNANIERVRAIANALHAQKGNLKG